MTLEPVGKRADLLALLLSSSYSSAVKVARSEAPLLILGETGTGRSSLARRLHDLSGRSGGPLVEMDVTTIPVGLFESEVFGSRAGAFTGAEETILGRVERAEGGTLVLDNVEETPLGSQPKLLRVLAEARFTPLGGTELEADVRFVAIGPLGLFERVGEGTFRSDLYYRLEVLTVQLPSLRERIGDLEAIVRLLLDDLGQRAGLDEIEIDPRALEWMTQYDWPGNVRELRNVLQRALILRGESPFRPQPPRAFEQLPRKLAEVEEQEIRRTLAFTRGHQGRAAELLGISRKSLWEKRRRLGIP